MRENVEEEEEEKNRAQKQVVSAISNQTLQHGNVLMERCLFDREREV